MEFAAQFEVHVSGASAADSLAGFETVAARIRELERLDLEPDGFFVWAIDGKRGWRISGMIYDDGVRVQYVHLQGKSPWHWVEQLLRQIEPNVQQLQFTRLPMGGLQDFQTFRETYWRENARD